MKIRFADARPQGDYALVVPVAGKDRSTLSALGASQQNVSKHLGVLLQAGMVSRAKQGTSARYAIADPDVFALCEQVCGGIRRQTVELDALLQGTVIK